MRLKAEVRTDGGEMRSETEVWEYLEQISGSGIVMGLESMRELMEELGNIQNALKVVHVAGTNGKGSVCALASSILGQAGIRAGRYTSPAVFDRKEQYQVNGQNITAHEVVEVFSQVRRACENLLAKGRRQPTVFEVETAAAFLWFYRRRCQVVVLETGMGGETDATNIIEHPLVSVLTSISMDHVKFLGNDLVQIAQIKAGIIKEGCRVVAVKPQQKAEQKEIEAACREKQAVLSYSEVGKARHVRQCIQRGEMRQYFTYPLCRSEKKEHSGDELSLKDNYSEIELFMMGDYQIENAVCAIETVKTLCDCGFTIRDEDILMGISQARWEGRFSVLCRQPMFVVDGAHNEDAAKKLAETLKRGFTNRKIIYIIGVLADKAHEEMMEIMLPLAQKVYTVTPNHPRAMDGQVLAAEAAKYHACVSYCATVEEAVDRAFSDAGRENSLILAFGSLSYLADLQKAVRELV